MKKTVPYGWLAVAGVSVASAALARRFLLPRAGRSLRRRVVEEANGRLLLPLPDFKLARRGGLLNLLMRDPAILEVVEEYSREPGASREEVIGKAECYAREILPDFDPYVYFRVGVRLAGLVARSFYRVELGSGVPSISPSASVVFVMNHRSNLDYVILVYLFRDVAALSFAAGEWARGWPVGWIVRAMGSYFVRRGSGDRLHRRVLERFVRMAVEGGLTQVIFPEGGLSRDGKMREPKVGLMEYMLRRFDLEGDRDLVFVPVAFNYDSVIEDRALLAALAPGASKPDDRRIPAQAILSILHNIKLLLTGRHLPYAVVNCGAPVSMLQYAASLNLDFRASNNEQRSRGIQALARYLMREISRSIPVPSVPLIAHIFTSSPNETLTITGIKTRARDLISSLEAQGTHVHVPEGDRDIEAGLRLLISRGLVLENGGLYRASPRVLEVLHYYADSISHLMQ